MTQCPFCAEEIQDAAVVCRFCGRDIPSPDVATIASDLSIGEGAPRPKKLSKWIIGGVVVAGLLIAGVKFISSDEPQLAVSRSFDIDGKRRYKVPFVIEIVNKGDLPVTIESISANNGACVVHPVAFTRLLATSGLNVPFDRIDWFTMASEKELRANGTVKNAQAASVTLALGEKTLVDFFTVGCDTTPNVLKLDVATTKGTLQYAFKE